MKLPIATSVKLSRSGCCCVWVVFVILDMLFCTPFAGYTMANFAGNYTLTKENGVFSMFITFYAGTLLLLGCLVVLIMKLAVRIQIGIQMVERLCNIIFLVFIVESSNMDATKENITWFVAAFFIIHVVFNAMLICYGDADSKPKPNRSVFIDFAKTWIAAAFFLTLSSLFIKFVLKDTDMAMNYFVIYTFGLEALVASAYFGALPEMFHGNEDDTNSDREEAGLQSTA